MKVAFDIDGAADLDPQVMQSLMSSLLAAGHQVVILTGCSNEIPTQQDWNEKAQYLQSIGQGACWDELVIFGDPPHKAKAHWIRDNAVDLLIDNSVSNAKMAGKYCIVLVPWASKTD